MIMKRMMNGLRKPSPPQAAVPVAAPVESGGKLPPPTLQHPICPRCESSNTKFCYYNNYSVSQPRYFCKGCKRYWTHGGTLRNVPHGGRSLGNTKLIPCKQLPSSSSNFIFPPNPKPQHYQQAQAQQQQHQQQLLLQQQQQKISTTTYYQQGAVECSFNHYLPTDSMMMMSSSSSSDFMGASSSCDQFPAVFNQPTDIGSSSSYDQFHMFNQAADIVDSTTSLFNEQQDYWLDHHLSSFNGNGNSNSSSSSSNITHTNAVDLDYDSSNWNAILGYESPLHSSSSAYFFDF